MLVTSVCVHVEVLAAGVEDLVVDVGLCGSVVGGPKAPDTHCLESRLPSISTTSTGRILSLRTAAIWDMAWLTSALLVR